MLKEDTRAKLLDALPQDVRSRFQEAMVEMKTERGTIVYDAAENPRGVYFLQSGLIGLVVSGSSGSEHLARFFRTHDFFGHRSFLAGEPYHARAMALTKSVIQFVPGPVIEWALDTSPVFRRLVIDRLVAELKFAEIHSFNLTENQVLERVGLALVYLKQIDPVYNWTRQEIASFCVSTISTVIKMLNTLEEMGFIKQDGRTITLLGPELSQAIDGNMLLDPKANVKTEKQKKE